MVYVIRTGNMACGVLTPEEYNLHVGGMPIAELYSPEYTGVRVVQFRCSGAKKCGSLHGHWVILVTRITCRGNASYNPWKRAPRHDPRPKIFSH